MTLRLVKVARSDRLVCPRCPAGYGRAAPNGSSEAPGDRHGWEGQHASLRGYTQLLGGGWGAGVAGAYLIT
jgi:hypothetical protein